MAAVEATEERIDRELWAALAAADLLGLAVPGRRGWAGLGLTELCLLLEAQGAVVAPVPLWATLVLGALPIARFGPPNSGPGGSPAWRPARCSSRAALAGTAGACRAPGGAGPAAPGRGWRLEGTELAVPQAHLAARVLVPARTPDDGVVLALVDPAAEGVALERAVTTNREIHPHLHLDAGPVGPTSVVAGPDGGRRGPGGPLQAAWTGLCALQVGVSGSALRQTAAYLNERHQFGRPLSAFQGAMLRAADAAIDLEAMPVTLWQAAWRLDTGRPAARGGGRGQVAGRRARPAGGARHPAPPRRDGRRRQATPSTATSCGASSSSCSWAVRAGSWPGSAALVGGRRRRRPERAGDRRGPRPCAYEEVSVGDALAPLALPVTRTLIVAGALASRDYQDVHHDAELARRRGSKDIFMNILTTNGLVGRYVTDWSGPGGILRRVDIRLGAPNYPDDAMTLTGSVTAKAAPSPTAAAAWSRWPCGGPTAWATT